MQRPKQRKRGFSLIELVVAILIVGILASVAAPRLVNTSTAASENGLRQSLAVIRDAIDFYATENGGALPGSDGKSSTFKSDLAPYLRGSFPEGPVGYAQGDNRVRVVGTGLPLSGKPTPNRAWRYDYTTGEFIYNFNGISSDGVTSYEDF